MTGLARRIGWWRTLALHRFFPGVALRRNLARDKEDELELALLPALVDPARAALDVGANVGSYTAALIQLARHVIAIEPHPRMARILRAFPREQVSVHQVISSGTDGKAARLAVAVMDGREADTLAHVDDGSQAGETRLFEVQTATLDAITKASPTGFVKVDVEGHEFAVLDGAARLLTEDRPIWLIESEARHSQGAPFTLFERMEAASYHGLFAHEGQMHEVATFDLSMQDYSKLEGYARRREADYVNNFIFVPREREFGAIRAACDKLLAESAD